MVKVLLFLGDFWPWMKTGKVFVFPSHFRPRLLTVKVFDFWAILAKDSNGESFDFSLSFLAKDTNGESFVFSWSFLAKDTNGESFCFSWTFLSKVTFIATSALNTNNESYVCHMRFRATSGIPLCQTQFHVRWRQSLATHCASRSLGSGRQLLV